MFSGLPPTADIGERDWHVSVVPSADMKSQATGMILACAAPEIVLTETSANARRANLYDEAPRVHYSAWRHSDLAARCTRTARRRDAANGCAHKQQFGRSDHPGAPRGLLGRDGVIGLD